MVTETFLSRSRQTWKLHAMAGVMVIGVVALSWGIASEGWFIAYPLGIAIGWGGFLWGARSIKCPACVRKTALLACGPHLRVC